MSKDLNQKNRRSPKYHRRSMSPIQFINSDSYRKKNSKHNVERFSLIPSKLFSKKTLEKPKYIAKIDNASKQTKQNKQFFKFAQSITSIQKDESVKEQSDKNYGFLFGQNFKTEQKQLTSFEMSETQETLLNGLHEQMHKKQEQIEEKQKEIRAQKNLIQQLQRRQKQLKEKVQIQAIEVCMEKRKNFYNRSKVAALEKKINHLTSNDSLVYSFEEELNPI